MKTMAKTAPLPRAEGRSLGRNDLIASYYTLSGAPVGQPARFSFEERVAAAAAAGFAAIGLAVEDYEACRDGVGNRTTGGACQRRDPDRLLALLPWGGGPDPGAGDPGRTLLCHSIR